MKKQFFLLVLAIALIISCASASNSPAVEEDWLSGNSSSNRPSNFSDVTDVKGNEWKLIGVYVNGTNTGFNRNTLPERLRNFFTMNFDAEIVSGVGAPNLYSAPFTMGDSQISIMLMRSTMMALSNEPENLNEYDFFIYLQNAHTWKSVNNTLELLSKTRDGGEVRLVFSL